MIEGRSTFHRLRAELASSETFGYFSFGRISVKSLATIPQLIKEPALTKKSSLIFLVLPQIE